ncbi:Hypothetical predicted protein [Mytilus galloprovincialis]|uniref:Uncharacterized protein n=1 Tax=Mytilus galloprovincialis TaxID=29158 RepID=A0A8B6C7N3_MYTGA|nr:Hypothetical predicted protein [Mytilus galloprovincialis]
MTEKIESEIENASSNIEEISLSFEWNHVVKKVQERVASIGEIRIANPKQYSVEIAISCFPVK